MSLVGLILTISARDFAKKARKAAEAAKEASKATEEAFLQQSLLHAVTESRRLASELVTLLSSNLHAAGLIRSQDLSGSLRFVVVRWDQHLLTSKSELAEAMILIDSVTKKLNNAATTPLSAPESKRITQITQRALNLIIATQALAEKETVHAERRSS